MNSSSILSQKALAIPANVRESYLLNIPEVDLHKYLSRLLENMDSGARCEVTHGRDEFGRDIVLRRSSPFGKEYLAIVVKRGDAKGKVSGRTSGPVDEVLSQAKQSVAHICYLKEIEISPVTIGGVWVMFFGRLTANAVKRLVKESPALMFEPFAIGWLADSFAKHYPEVFFAGAASTFLQEKVIEFETHHDFSRRLKNLSDSYVEPSVSVTPIQGRTFSERLRRALKLKRLTYQEFRKKLNSRTRFILSAPPGLGKSTLLRKLALDIYRESLTGTASLGTNPKAGALNAPIVVSATKLAEYEDVDSFLDEYLPPAEVRSAFSIEALLVDALDEVPQEMQVKTLALACDVANRLSCAMIVSARPVQVISTLSERSAMHLPVVQLLPFEYSQARQLIDRLVGDPDTVEILREGLASLRSHMSLSPLAVSLLMDIAEAEREVPGTIGEIFEQYMDIALGRYDVERGIEVVFQYFIKKQLLAELAWHAFFNGDRLTISEREFDDFLRVYFEDRLFSPEMISRMKEDIDRSGIIRFSDGVYFAHRSFLDFFVALYAHDHSSDLGNASRWLAKVYYSDKWSEVSFYFFAQRREVLPGFFDEALKLGNESIEFHLRTYMIGRLLQAGWLSPSAIKSNGIEFGISSAPKLFELLSDENADIGPQAVPYAIMTGLAENSYSSRTLHKEVSMTVVNLTKGNSIEDFRSAVNLLWANRTRISTVESSAQADLVLDLMAQLEESRELRLEDKAVGFLILETIVEDDKERQRAIARRFRRLVKAQPAAVKRLLSGK